VAAGVNRLLPHQKMADVAVYPSVAAARRVRAQPLAREDIFDRIDTNQDGVIDRGELQRYHEAHPGLATHLRRSTPATGSRTPAVQRLRSSATPHSGMRPGCSSYQPVHPQGNARHGPELAPRSSFQTSAPTILSTAASTSDLKGGDGFCHFLMLQFLGLSGLPGAGWLERRPSYELIIRAGDSAKRLRPRVPAPPPGSEDGSGIGAVDVEALVPRDMPVIRLDERMNIRMADPVNFFHIDVWEEKVGLFDFGSKGPNKRLLGQCYVPLEQPYNKRPCTWAILSRAEKDGTPIEAGYITCRFSLATTPGPVRNLRLVEQSIGATEVQLAWDPPSSDGGTPLRGYRVEARDLVADASAAQTGFLADTPRTASAPPSQEPTTRLRNLRGNTAYHFRVWALSEAGPGPRAEIIGCTGPVAPGPCGAPRPSACGKVGDSVVVEWTPPVDTGGANIVAYRLLLRALFHDRMGHVFPGDSWVDLGLFEHRGRPDAPQATSVHLGALPEGSGCICSVAALNSAGHTGNSSHGVLAFATLSYGMQALPAPEETEPQAVGQGVESALAPQPASEVLTNGKHDEKVTISWNYEKEVPQRAHDLAPCRGDFF